MSLAIWAGSPFLPVSSPMSNFFVDTHGRCQKSAFVHFYTCEVPSPFEVSYPPLRLQFQLHYEDETVFISSEML